MGKFKINQDFTIFQLILFAVYIRLVEVVVIYVEGFVLEHVQVNYPAEPAWAHQSDCQD